MQPSESKRETKTKTLTQKFQADGSPKIQIQKSEL